ncbi:MAG TPA: hypothetical protein VGF14_02475 [Alphaproteobacteria bacterium]
MNNIAESMMNLPPENRARLSLVTLQFAQNHIDHMDSKNPHLKRNILKGWINSYGPFVPGLPVEDPNPTEKWQIYAEQIKEIIAPVNQHGEERSLDDRARDLYNFLTNNRDDFSQAMTAKPPEENGPN